MNQKHHFYYTFFLIFSFFLFTFEVMGQTTYNPKVDNKKNAWPITKIELTPSEMIVYVQGNTSSDRGAWYRFTSATIWLGVTPIPAELKRINLDYPEPPSYFDGSDLSVLNLEIILENGKKIEEAREILRPTTITKIDDIQLDTKYNNYSKETRTFTIGMHFPRPEKGVETISIIGLTKNLYYWEGIHINNPHPAVLTTSYDEATVKAKIDEQNDGIVGIYEAVNYNGYKLACVKIDGEYKLIFLSSTDKGINTTWKIGEVKAILRPTAQTFFFKADWYMANKSKNSDCYISFDGTTMKTIFDGEENTYLKMYPAASTTTNGGEWGGTGFALNSGYVITNHHVIDGANTIEIYGVKGDFETPYTATVVASDKNNDLALLKINDNRFMGFGTIPYKIKTTQSDVGETISVLGYPLTSTMGDEIKLTTGVISSRTGYQGDVSSYQISAAIQPGNSGGPLFDSYGNIIGIVSSKHKGAENVGYAVKASYLHNLIESCASTSILPSSTSLSGLSLPEKVKSSKDFIFMIRCK